jgi:RNA polymerase sigma factor for flagellar operon FliA
MSPEERQDWKLYKEQGDRTAHERLCERYLNQVRRIVGRMSIYLGDGALDKEDLIHAGVIGLIDALESYDPEREREFMEFAFKRIRGAVYDELRALDGFSSRSRRQQKHMERVKEELQNKFFRIPTEAETAQELGISIEQFRMLQSSVQSVRMEPLDPERDDQLPSPAAHSKMRHWIPAADGLSQAEKFRIVSAKIDELPERTKIVLGLYYRDGLTLKEIAEVMNLTESRICQIHAAAMEVLHQQLSSINEVFAEY